MKSIRFLSLFLFAATILFQPLAHVAGSANAAGGNGYQLREQLCKQLPVGKACGAASNDHWGTPPASTMEARNGVKITTKFGDVLFSDVTTLGSESADAKYRFVGFLTKHQYFLVSGIYYGEEQDYKFISYQTGGVHTLRGRPIISPKGDLFFVIPRWHGSVTTNIELYRIDASTIAKTDNWDFESCSAATRPACYSISEALWVSPSEVAAFTTVYVRKGTEQVRTLRYMGSVKREGDHWVIHKDPSK